LVIWVVGSRGHEADKEEREKIRPEPTPSPVQDLDEVTHENREENVTI
jgi:hypothetical protein